MEPQRQRLSQRRRAAVLAQGLRAERSGAAWSGAELFTASQAAATPVPATALVPATAPGRPSPPTIPVRADRSKRFPVAGVLGAVLAASAAFALLVPSPSRPVPSDNAETPVITAPVAAIPAPDPGSNDNTWQAENAGGAVHPLPLDPGTGPSTPTAAAATTASSAATASRSRDSQSRRPTPIRREPASPAVVAPSDTQPSPAQAYDALSRAAGLGAGDQYWTRHRPENHR